MPIVGWQRVASDNACAFCEMLAARGAVYSEESADFEAHDGCTCTVEPVWRREADPPAIVDLREEIATVTGGLSGRAALAAWRAHRARQRTASTEPARDDERDEDDPTRPRRVNR
jgi:hypothetical protein